MCPDAPKFKRLRFTSVLAPPERIADLINYRAKHPNDAKNVWTYLHVLMKVPPSIRMEYAAEYGARFLDSFYWDALQKLHTPEGLHEIIYVLDMGANARAFGPAPESDHSSYLGRWQHSYPHPEFEKIYKLYEKYRKCGDQTWVDRLSEYKSSLAIVLEWESMEKPSAFRKLF